MHDNSCSTISTDFTLDWDATPTGNQFNWTPQGSTTYTASNIEGTGNQISFAVTGETATLTTENSISTPGITNSLSGGADALHISSTGLNVDEEIILTMTFTPALAGDISFDIYNVIELSGGGAGGQQMEVFGLTSTGFAIIPELTDNGSPSWEFEGPGVLDGNATSTAGTNDQIGVNFRSISDISTISVILRRCNACANAANTEFAIGDIDVCLTPDTDQDGIADTQDADDDNDGILDIIEKCPTSDRTLADWDNYTYTNGDPSNTYALPDGTNMTVAVASNGASIVAGETNDNIIGGEAAGTVGLFINGNQNLRVNSIDVTFSWDQAIDSLEYTIFDVDRIVTQWVDSITIIGFYDGFVVFPQMTPSVNNTVTQNRVVGDVNTAETSADANVDVAFSEPIDSMIIYYGNGSDAPAAPGNQWITIWDFSYIGDCGSVDSDGDGIADYLDIDADNDGIVDYIEWQVSSPVPIAPAGADSDGDGIDNNFESVSAPVDTDGDGIPDFQDPDSDDDGDLDILEAWDTDNDGIANTLPAGTDTDGDGLDDNFDNQAGFNSTTNITNNGQTSSSFPDLDDVLTAERDWREDTDIDDDGVQDYDDIDDDNDGILDVNEGRGSNNPNGDEDGDGIPNWADITDNGNGGDGSTTDYTNSNGDNIPDVFDTDNDGIPNHHDPDADGDGIADIVEAGGVDIDGNGVVDGIFSDIDGDGWSDLFDADDGGTALTDVDLDADGFQNHTDIDADNDGIVDIIESQPSGALISPSGTDSDGDGIDDNFDTDSGNSLTTPVNIDGTDNPDFLDTDTDNDGDSDQLEGYDTDNDGTANTLPAGTDTDNDGLDDNFDNVVGQNSTTNITNSGQSSATFPNLDDVGTTELDWREIDRGNDFDGDGIDDATDIDDDNDGILDTDEGCSTATSGPSGPVVASGGGNGVNAGQFPLINDGDLTADNGIALNRAGEYIVVDLGSSIPSGTNITFTLWQNNTNNKTLRFAELPNSTPNLGGGSNAQTITQASIATGGSVTSFVYTLTAATQYVQVEMTVRAGGRIEVIEATVGAYSSCAQDTDNDGIVNSYDLDSDNDGIPDIVEAGGIDADGNGIVDGTFIDTDNDGWSNTFDSDDGGVALTDPDTDSDGLENRIDIDADGDGIVDIIESQPSGTLKTPSGNDSDGDGIDDNFDLNQGNTLTTPVNTDSADNPDYTDTDSDNDGDLDALEGWDTNNTGIANTTPAGSDADNDGLDDNYDNIVGPNATTNVTNGGQTSASFPNIDRPTTAELDWREDQDNDGDGVPDITDVDDDNDGILDTDEGFCVAFVVNGGLESPVIGCTSYSIVDEGTVSGWNHSAASGNIINCGSNSGTPGGEIELWGTTFLGVASDEGSQHAEINAYNSGTMSQTFALPSIGTYILEWSIAQRGRSGIDSMRISITEGANPLVDSVVGAGNTEWSTHSGTAAFTTTGLSVVFGLGSVTTASGSASVGNFIDDVNVCVSTDTDGDGIADYLDVDSDNDGIVDIIEAGGVDADNDGVVDGVFTDTDGDGWSNTFDADDGGTALVDSDKDLDGLENRIDKDSDGDGIGDINEAGGTDADGDGEVDGTFTDVDSDGWSSVFDSDESGTALTIPDTDGDGLADPCDIDSDGDGIVDIIESQVSGGLTSPDGTDTDGDGIDDNFDTDSGNSLTTPTDTDGDGEQDYIDINSDGDLQPDILEGWDTNNDGVPNTGPSGTDSDGDGLDDNFDNVVGPNSTTNITNGGQTSASFPNLDETTTAELDWREINDLDIDGTANDLDIDDDNDGILDTDERNCTSGFANAVTSSVGVTAPTAALGIPDGSSAFIPFNGVLVLDLVDTVLAQHYIRITMDRNGDNRILVEGSVDNVTYTNAVTYGSNSADVDMPVLNQVYNFLYPAGSGGVRYLRFTREASSTDLDAVTFEPQCDPVDTDGDGIEDYLDLDSDNDGIPDIVEAGGVDANNDGIVDGVFTDTDNDGWSDVFDSDNGGTALPITNTDGSGNADFRDLDSDDDGVQDIIEAGGIDADNNAVVDGAFTDTDGDGWSNTFDSDDGGTALTITNTDGTGNPDYIDLDSDDDGIPDIVEAGGEDVDNNGVADTPTDTDNDGWANTFDSDNGGVALDNTDTDNDGVDNRIDLDSDGDGIADILEAGGIDADFNGIVDGVFTDTDGDGWSDTFDSDDGGTALADTDTDSDGFQNRIDIDADNDGIVDIVESQASGVLISPAGSDADGDGIDDNFDPDSGNSLTDPENTDGEDNPDYLDLNSDNDFQADLLEGYDTDNDNFANTLPSGSDSDNDGLDDNFDNVVGPNSTTNVTNSGQTSSSFPDLDDAVSAERDWREFTDIDTDGDGVLNSVDVDDDNDGILDVDERACSSTGYADVIVSQTGVTSQSNALGDPDANSAILPLNAVMVVDLSDTVLTYNYIRLRMDRNNNNRILVEGSIDNSTYLNGFTYGNTSADFDMPIVDQQYDLLYEVGTTGVRYLRFTREAGSTDLDAINYALTCPINDEDGDGIENYLDLDSDGDGIGDIVEAGGLDADNDGVVDGVFTDTDGDGWSDTFDPDNGGTILADSDTDNDGSADRIDIDADNDGIVDIIEAQASGTITTPSGTDTDGDGIDDNFDTDSGNALLVPVNTDGTDNPDYIDTDSDNDGDGDILEGWDNNNDGQANTIPSGTDTDGDGLDDNFDNVVGPNTTTNITNGGQTSSSFPDFDEPASLERDWREEGDNDNDGIANFIDIDDDNDGVLDLTELNCTSSGYGDAVTSSVGVTGAGSALNAPDGSYAILPLNAVLVVDLTDLVAQGQYIRFRMNRNNSNRVLVEGSANNAAYTNPTSYGNTSADFDMPTVGTDYDFFYEIGTGGARYIRFTREVGSTDLDAITYSPTCGDQDADNDGIQNHWDLDSDNDGILDIIEAGGVDADGNGVVDGAFTDTDNDGWANTFDADNGGTALADPDNDGDGFASRIDIDADGDGIVDIVEAGGTDANNDGRVDSSTDTDSDGYANTFDSDNGGTALPVTDTDGDGVQNYLDLDSDSDGITDNVEGQTTAAFQAPIGSDTDNDGWDNRYDSDNGGTAITLSNNEGAGNPDYLDDDSDGDTQPDWHEGFDDDEDTDALNDLILRAANFETAAGNPLFYVNADDGDGDGFPDWIEDDDADNVPNFLDPDNADYHDTDGDGLIDLYDTDNFGTASILPDGDGDGEYDFRDTDDAISLPIVLKSFTATKMGKVVRLDWSTLTEINNDYFTIERASSDFQFKTILSYPGAGNSNVPLYYSLIDHDPELAVNYYRLKQTDYDGSYSYSKIESVVFELNDGYIQLFPNPNKGNDLYIQLNNLVAGDYTIDFLSARGDLLVSKQLLIDKKEAQLTYPLFEGEMFAKGLYFVRIRSAFGELNFKLVIQ